MSQPVEIKIKEENGKRLINCFIRKRWLVLSPEEWVRQHFLQFIINELKIPIIRIGVEVSLKYNQLNKRVDILVYNKEGKASWIIECKEQGVNLNENVIQQALIYNSKLDVNYVSITNGINHNTWQKTGNDFKLIEIWPDI